MTLTRCATGSHLVTPVGLTPAGQAAGEVVRDPSDRVVGVGQPVEREIEVNRQLRASLQQPVDGSERLLRQQPVGRQVQVPHSIVAHKQLDDLGQVLAQHRLAARDPQFAEGGGGGRHSLDLGEAQVIRAVQLVEIEAGAAQRVAPRGDEQKQRAKLTPATAVSQDPQVLDGSHDRSVLQS
jgi:hypothetical protein